MVKVRHQRLPPPTHRFSASSKLVSEALPNTTPQNYSTQRFECLRSSEARCLQPHLPLRAGFSLQPTHHDLISSQSKTATHHNKHPIMLSNASLALYVYPAVANLSDFIPTKRQPQTFHLPCIYRCSISTEPGKGLSQTGAFPSISLW